MDYSHFGAALQNATTKVDRQRRELVLIRNIEFIISAEENGAVIVFEECFCLEQDLQDTMLMLSPLVSFVYDVELPENPVRFAGEKCLNGAKKLAEIFAEGKILGVGVVVVERIFVFVFCDSIVED